MFDNAEMKYIVVNDKGFEAAIIFDITMDHSEIAKGHHVISAGMMNVYDKDGKITVGCYGKSVTLNLKAREDEDSALVQRHLIYIP